MTMFGGLFGGCGNRTAFRGLLFCSDAGHHRVVVRDQLSETPDKAICTIGKQGQGDGEFVRPAGKKRENLCTHVTTPRRWPGNRQQLVRYVVGIINWRYRNRSLMGLLHFISTHSTPVPISLAR